MSEISGKSRKNSDLYKNSNLEKKFESIIKINMEE